MNLETINCEICGLDQYTVILPNCRALSGPLVECTHCGLVYVNPRKAEFAVNETTVDSSSRRVAVWEKYNEVFGGSLQVHHEERDHHLKNFQMRVDLIKRFADRGKLLDIGSGQGHFLNAAQLAGFEVIGIEPNQQTAQISQERYGVPVVNGVLPQEGFVDLEFDAVSLLHVLEHLPHPGQELEKIHRVLKPDGLLLIEVPNIDTIWFRLLKSRWRQFIPDHYFFFTSKTLARLLNQHGFEVLETSVIGKKMSVGFFLSRLQRYSRPIATVSKKMARALNLIDKNIYLNLGDVIYVVARKV